MNRARRRPLITLFEHHHSNNNMQDTIRLFFRNIYLADELTKFATRSFFFSKL